MMHFLKSSLSALALAAFTLSTPVHFAGFSAIAQAGDDELCVAQVYGLSNNYNPSRGSGFLAVRSGPGKGYRKIAELFNGERINIIRERGSWLFVEKNGDTGWVFKRYVRPIAC